MNFKLSKRAKYLLQSIVLGLLLYLFSEKLSFLFFSLLASVILIFVGNFIVYSENKPKALDVFYISLLPLHLIAGAMLSFYYFPNLSQLFRIGFIIGLTVLNYIILLVGNIFLVVKEREEPIPLYRVALTWGRIVMVVLCIPFFAGVFKIPTNTFVQSTIVGLSSILFCLYTVWSMQFESEVKKHGAGEAGYLAFIGGIFIGLSNLVVSFMPSESFLRALFVVSILMFALNYIYAHFKNAINKRLITEHTIISLLFLLLLLLFKP